MEDDCLESHLFLVVKTNFHILDCGFWLFNAEVTPRFVSVDHELVGALFLLGFMSIRSILKLLDGIRIFLRLIARDLKLFVYPSSFD